MVEIKGYYDGEKFVPIEKVNIEKNQMVAIRILDDYLEKNEGLKPHRKYMGRLDKESYIEIIQALKECDKVDEHEW